MNCLLNFYFFLIFQCFTHRYLGWKINVHDSCDEQPAASNLEPAIAKAPEGFSDTMEVELEESPSLKIETRVKANDIISVDNGDKETKSIISEKKIVETQNLPSPTPGQADEHSQAPVNHFTTQQLTLPDPYSTSLENIPQQAHHLHQQQSYSTENYFESTTIFPSSSLRTNRTTDETAQITNKHVQNSFKLPFLTNNSFAVRPPPKNSPNLNEYIIPRPIPPHTYPTRPISNYNNNFNSYNIRPVRAKPSKKFVPRSPYQKYRPYNFEFERPMRYPSRQQTNQFISLSGSMNYRIPQLNNNKINKTSFGEFKQVENVEISPLQASTEREPEIQTASMTHVIDNTPIFRRPAINTGFKPSSIKLETGFKPIISKELQDRMDQNDEDIDIQDEGETGIIEKDKENNYEYKPVHDFEPMFVPSPTDKFVKEKYPKVNKRPNKKVQHFIEIIIKQPRSFNESQDELEAEAAERSETYYLPPKGQIPIEFAREPSNIDIETPAIDLKLDSPPDVVVTYDGKRVSGQSLTAKISERPSAFESRISKASTFLKARPQFGKFSGELPPLNPESLFGGTQRQQIGVLNRELDTPVLPSGNNGGSSSLKLSRIAVNFPQVQGEATK